jgi:hypothetical protein
MAVTASPTRFRPEDDERPPQITGMRVERRCELAPLLEEEVPEHNLGHRHASRVSRREPGPRPWS